MIPVVDLDRRLAYANRTTEQDLKDKGVSAELNWTTPWANDAVLTSITAFRDWEAITSIDFDYSAADILYRPPNPDGSLVKFENFSQELRLTGSSDRIDWMVGLFYSDEDLARNDSYFMGAAYEPYLSTLVGTQVLGGLAQQLAPFEAACLGAWLHAAAGERLGPLGRGLAASDLIPVIRQLFEEQSPCLK